MSMENSAMIKAVLFDGYGTLLRLTRDSNPYALLLRNCYQFNFESAKHSAMTQQTNSLYDFTHLVRINHPYNLDNLERELKHDLNSAQLYPETLDAINKLKLNNIKVGLISNLATPYIKPFKTLGLIELLDVVHFSCEVGLKKPDPEIFHSALSTLGLTASDAVMIGDSMNSDVLGARKAGLIAYHLDRSLHHSSIKDGKIASLTDCDQVLQHPLL